MKVIDVIEIREEGPGNGPIVLWRPLPDNVLVKGGNPFFIPDFEGDCQAHGVLALRIGRLGKGVEPRFASRYVDGMAAAIVFRCEDHAARLRAAGLPDSPAYCFDKAVALGDFSSPGFPGGATLLDAELSMEPKKGSTDSEATSCSIDTRLLLSHCAAAVSAASRDNTLRTGDIVTVPLPLEPLECRAPFRLNLNLNCGAERLSRSINLI